MDDGPRGGRHPGQCRPNAFLLEADGNLTLTSAEGEIRFY